MAPLDARIKKSTEEWVKSKAVREQRRRELEAEQCTFYPALGGGPGGPGAAGGGASGGGRNRRSSSAGPRARTNASRAAATAVMCGEEEGPRAAAARAFEASASALQQAQETRRKTLRKQRLQLDLQETTFEPAIGGFEGHPHRRTSTGTEGKNPSGSAAAPAGTAEAAMLEAVAVGAGSAGDMSAAQRKEAPFGGEKKEAIGFKVGAAVCCNLCIASFRQAERCMLRGVLQAMYCKLSVGRALHVALCVAIFHRAFGRTCVCCVCVCFFFFYSSPPDKPRRNDISSRYIPLCPEMRKGGLDVRLKTQIGTSVS